MIGRVKARNLAGTRRISFLLGIVVLALSFLAVACSSSDSAPSTPVSTPTTPGSPEFSGIVAATEFAVGENRFPFGILSIDGGLLEDAQVNVSFYSLQPEQAPEFRSEAPAKFRRIEGVTPHEHEDGTIHEHIDARTVYVVDGVRFDDPGFWGAEFAVTSASGEQLEVRGLAFEVKTETSAPDIGDQVPPSRNLTVHDVDNIEEIDTHVPPDDMHDLSVVQALEQGKPFVVVFSTPMFCVSRMCGPVTDVAIQLQGRYGGQVSFIHIEPWDLAIARGEGRLVQIDIAKEWNLPTEPWIFVVNEQGRVASRFEGLVSTEELEAAIISAING